MSEDNTKRELGFTYQALWALRLYLENSNESEWEMGYETNGDITIWDGCSPKLYIESKYHSNKGNLTASSVDFWKTLKNTYYAFSNDKMPTFDKYILLTTEKNCLDSKNLYNFIISAKCKNKDKYFPSDVKLSKLRDLCSRFEIWDGKPLTEKMLSDIFKYFTLIENDDNKLNFVISIASLFDKGTIFRNPDDRKICFPDIKKAIEQHSASYVGNKQILIDPSESFECTDNIYIDELKSINIHDEDIHRQAKKDFIFTMYNKLEILTTPVMIKEVSNYENDLKESLCTMKSMNRILKKSEIENYSACINKVENSDLEVRGVKMKSIYHRGSAHYLVDQAKIKWKYEDLNEQ